MKNILFIVLGHISNGEFTIASEFARRLDSKKYKVTFLTCKRGDQAQTTWKFDIVVLPMSIPYEPQTNLQRVKLLIGKLKPDIIIASDIYTLEYSKLWSGVDYKELHKFGIPIVSFDEYGYRGGKYVQDYYGGFVKRLPPFIDKCDFTICHCPPNNIKGEMEPTEFRCSLYDLEYIAAYKAKRILNISRNTRSRPQVFLVKSKWESLDVNRFLALSRLNNYVPLILTNYLSELEKPVDLIHVGPDQWNISEALTGEYHFYNSLPPNVFNDLLINSDLFITLNIISVTLSNAVLLGVPSMVFANMKLLDFDKHQDRLSRFPQWYQQMARDIRIIYPFYTFPFGWFTFLSQLLMNNQYTETFTTTKIFNYNQTVNLLNKILFDPDYRMQSLHNQERYLQELKLLMKPQEIMDQIFNRIGSQS